MFIADIPPVTPVQEARYEILVDYIHNNKYQASLTDIERLKLTFLVQANRYIEASKRTDFEKAKLNYERMALLNFQAYLVRLGK